MERQRSELSFACKPLGVTDYSQYATRIYRCTECPQEQGFVCAVDGLLPWSHWFHEAPAPPAAYDENVPREASFHCNKPRQCHLLVDMVSFWGLTCRAVPCRWQVSVPTRLLMDVYKTDGSWHCCLNWFIFFSISLSCPVPCLFFFSDGSWINRGGCLLSYPCDLS